MATFKMDDPGPFAGNSLVFLNRCRSHAIACGESRSGFIFDGEIQSAAKKLGIVLQESTEDVGLSRLPRIAIYCGEAIGYPYWAYYAHALLSLGLTYIPLKADAVAAGRLNEFDLLIMPGGFATWGLDRAEKIQGVDAAISSFIASGGALIGSCGGAFYASAGRPGWLGLIDATPKYTQEYLLTGAALLSISVSDPILGRGLPETIELPYYHGPVYSNEDRSALSLGHFRSFVQESRLFIDNPLDPALFAHEMKSAPAVLAAPPEKGRVLVFSPHPEMGEFLRKGITLDSYVRHFLPIRGHKVMDQTLQFFMKEDCAGFRLIYNALVYLKLFEPVRVATQPTPSKIETTELMEALATTDSTLSTIFEHLEKQVQTETVEMQALLAAEFGRTREEWNNVLRDIRAQCQSGPVDSLLQFGLTAALNDAVAALAAPPSGLAENIVLAELPIRLSAAALRLIICDRALETSQ